MPAPRRASKVPTGSKEQLRYAREIISLESRALENVARRLDGQFCRAVEACYTCGGSVITSGMGKAGVIAQKIAATLASTGTRSHFLHPAEAVHGDLGRIRADDVLLVFSQSGETEEVVRLLPSLAEFGVRLIAVTARRTSTLGRAAHAAIELGPLQEACELGLAPSTSTTAMLALGDALALVTSRLREFGREDFARFHPAGALGRKLSKVDEFMRPLAECRVAPQSETVRQVFVEHGRAGRRTGAIMLVDKAGKLAGLFTDSDLARLLESKRDAAIDRPIRDVMTVGPSTAPHGSMMLDAVAIMAERKISELPVVDRRGRPLGMLDVTDVVALFPEASASGLASLGGGGDRAVVPFPAAKTKRRKASPQTRSRDCA
ncbi:MAG: KpsF/GutQ family sugar-phosphate isomerase [Planctomycetota bacterium]|nr:MAG: KpsF/GutQ family sugar-phosphate isomerase [Planctomycetota bacterium]